MGIIQKQFLTQELLFLWGDILGDFLARLNEFVWGVPALLAIIGVGLYITGKTRLSQLTLLPRSIVHLISGLTGKRNGGDTSSYRALCTALAATVGTGNIAGVAGGIAIGGPGAVFWMWICGILGMGIKFAEATLAVRYRVKDTNGELLGGPMYMIREGLPKPYHWMATAYCMLGVVAAFGVGNATQINTVVGSVNSAISAFGGKTGAVYNLIMGISLSVLIIILLSGGAERIGRAAEALVPFACGIYILLSVGVLVCRAGMIPQALHQIVVGAFQPSAVTGGVVGSVVCALRVGASRGVFTNEAGMGTAAIAHGAAEVKHPVEQGFMGIVEVFLDTIVICTLTALVILCSGTPLEFGVDTGASLAINAFSHVYGGWVTLLISASLCLFAVATVLGWGLYGARCAQYLFGKSAWKWFVPVQGITVIAGAVLGTGTVWLLAETVNGLMAIPNLIALALLAPELSRLVKAYKTCSCR